MGAFSIQPFSHGYTIAHSDDTTILLFCIYQNDEFIRSCSINLFWTAAGASFRGGGFNRSTRQDLALPAFFC